MYGNCHRFRRDALLGLAVRNPKSSQQLLVVCCHQQDVYRRWCFLVICAACAPQRLETASLVLRKQCCLIQNCIDATITTRRRVLSAVKMSLLPTKTSRWWSQNNTVPVSLDLCIIWWTRRPRTKNHQHSSDSVVLYLGRWRSQWLVLLVQLLPLRLLHLPLPLPPPLPPPPSSSPSPSSCSSHYYP